MDHLGAGARGLLGRLAQLSIEPIPRGLLEVPASGLEDTDLEDAAVELCDRSLTTFSSDGLSLIVHRLVQEVTRDDLAEAGAQDPTLAAALGWLQAATAGTSPQDVRDWPRLLPLLPHARAAVDRTGAEGQTEDAARSHLLNEFGVLLRHSAQYAEAEPLLRRALKIDEASHDPDRPNVSTRLHNLALLLRTTNRLVEAEPMSQRMLLILLRFTAATGHQHFYLQAATSNYATIVLETRRDISAILAKIDPLCIDAGVVASDWKSR